MGAVEIVNWTYCFSSDCLVSGAYNWQTMIGGSVAIGAAWYAGRKVRDQIKAASDQEQVRYQRRLNAVRAVLPLTLSGMSEYAMESAASLEGVKLGLDLLEGTEKIPGMSPLAIPHNLVADIASTIEATDDANVIQMLRQIVSEVQVLDARINALHMRMELENIRSQELRENIDRYLIDCAIIDARCRAMFEFARFETETVAAQLTWDDVVQALRLMKIYRETHANLYSFIDAQAEKGKLPKQ